MEVDSVAAPAAPAAFLAVPEPLALPLPIVPAAAAIPFVEQQPPAPYMIPSLKVPIWTVHGEEHSPLSVAGLINDVVHIGQKANMTKEGMMMVFELIRKCLPKGHKVPAFRASEEQLLNACSVKAKEYIVCANDCSLIRTSLSVMADSKKRTPAQKAEYDAILTRQTKCPDCKQPYVDAKQRVLKVRV